MKETTALLAVVDRFSQRAQPFFVREGKYIYYTFEILARDN